MNGMKFDALTKAVRKKNAIRDIITIGSKNHPPIFKSSECHRAPALLRRKNGILPYF